MPTYTPYERQRIAAAFKAARKVFEDCTCHYICTSVRWACTFGKLQAVHSQWSALCAAAHHIYSVNAEYKQLDSEAAEILAQAVGVPELTLTNALWYLGQAVRQPDEPSRKLLEALGGGAEAQKLSPLQKLVATHYQGGVFDHIETQADAQDVGDGLFTFCINEAGDAGDKPELINMLNHAIHQLRSLVGELEAVDWRVGEGVAA